MFSRKTTLIVAEFIQVPLLSSLLESISKSLSKIASVNALLVRKRSSMDVSTVDFICLEDVHVPVMVRIVAGSFVEVGEDRVGFSQLLE